MSNTEAQRTRTIDDAGEKIGGARKDWRDRYMSAADLDEMTGTEAIEHVNKDNVWPQPDWEAIVAEGMPVEAAAYVKIIRDRLAKTPRFATSGQDPAQTRKAYVEMIALLRDMLMSARDVNTVKNIYHDVVAKFGETFVRSDADTRLKFFSVYQGRTCPFSISYKDGMKADKMLSEGFPSKVPAWRKGVKTYPTSSGGVVLVKSGRQIGGTFADEAAAWKWLQDESAKSTPKAPKGPATPPDKPHLDHLERKGFADRRNGADVSADDFISTFGFRGVEFGLWLPDNERQQVLNLAYDALFDFAELLNWDASKLSLDGTLAVAFGARGGGKHRAHYEPGRKVINFTRLNGAGTLAHEYGHALDNWAGEVDRDGAARTVLSGTGWYYRTNGIKAMLTNLTEDQADAWQSTVDTFFMMPMEREEAMDAIRVKIRSFTEEIDKYEDIRAEHMMREPGRRNRIYIKKIDAYVADQKARRRVAKERLEKFADPNMETFGKTMSDYSKQASRLCGKSGEYWSRPTEMFARAFEAFVFDKMRERDAVSDYLVHGVEEDRYADPEQFKGNPYPTGSERTAFNANISRLVEAMKPRVELSPENPKP